MINERKLEPAERPAVKMGHVLVLFISSCLSRDVDTTVLDFTFNSSTDKSWSEEGSSLGPRSYFLQSYWAFDQKGTVT